MATIRIPVSAVAKLDVKSRPVRSHGQTVSLKCIEFYCKGKYSNHSCHLLLTFADMRTEIFGFTNDAVVDKIIEMCQKLMFHDNIPDLFAFSYFGRHGKQEGWEVYPISQLLFLLP